MATSPLLDQVIGIMKMSKSLDNYVAVDETPVDMYGKLMSVSDGQIMSYFEYLTDVPTVELAGMAEDLESNALNPMESKKRLAWDVTCQFHDREAADAAQIHFERVVQGRDLPTDIPRFNYTVYLGQIEISGPPGVQESVSSGNPANNLLYMLVGATLASSNREAKTLLEQGAIERIRPDGQSMKLNVHTAVSELNPGDVIRRGKRRFVRLTDS